MGERWWGLGGSIIFPVWVGGPFKFSLYPPIDGTFPDQLYTLIGESGSLPL